MVHLCLNGSGIRCKLEYIHCLRVKLRQQHSVQLKQTRQTKLIVVSVFEVIFPTRVSGLEVLIVAIHRLAGSDPKFQKVVSLVHSHNLRCRRNFHKYCTWAKHVYLQ